ncbi:MAG: response regulator transcription factor [Desulfosporosinus sp.]|nr:response regulator transcription factor [Desulfosporosinus sp.]
MSFDNEKLEKLKVLVVDDHTLFAEGTVALLSSVTNLEIVGIANNGNQCITLLKSKPPDIILLDISLPDCSGINLIDDIKSIHPEVKIIMLTGLNPQGYLTKSLQKGAHGFLLKECNKKEMIEAVFYVAQGKEYFSKGLAPFLKLAFVGNNGDKQALTSKPTDISEQLTGRQEEIMDLIAKGLNNQEISSTLGITIRTVKFHTGNILFKLGVKSRSKAVAAWTMVSKNQDESAEILKNFRN